MTTTTTPRVVPVALLDWPSEEDTDTTSSSLQQILCAGDVFIDYELRRMQLRDLRHGSSFLDDDDSSCSNSSSSEGESNEVETCCDLLSLSPTALEELDFYQVLGIKEHATFDQIKKAYHRACLKYHPDKTGRDGDIEEDAVFIKIKAAFDTLSDFDKRKSYDSIMLDFDESIPTSTDGCEEEFYDMYGPVFERNLRFDARLLQQSSTNGHSSKQQSRKGRRKNSLHDASKGPPSLGNDETPIDQVHAFYDYWTHFDSWRDFSFKAEKETKNVDLESADSRFEKRWMAKEIIRKSKAMKREEMARINLLVERAMAADPRLKRERQRERQEKERLQNEREEQERRQREQQQEEEQRQAQLQAKQQALEKEERARLKAEKEKEKKQLRKARQLLRKMSLSEFENDNESQEWGSLEEMHDDVEFLCVHLSVEQLTSLTDVLGAKDASSAASHQEIQKCVVQARAGLTLEEQEAERLREEARQAQAAKLREEKAQKSTNPWTKEELSALAKAIRKYPPGGANRWDTIALFINNVCKLADPRTKEECIEKYNQISKSGAAPSVVKQSSNLSDAATAGETTVDTWTEEQDKQLQTGLAKYPATMDKNERWTSIAKGVQGRTKKECVQRFKAIREALKSKKP